MKMKNLLKKFRRNHLNLGRSIRRSDCPRTKNLERTIKSTSGRNLKEQDLLLRTRAEIDNMRRRSEQDIEKHINLRSKSLKRHFKYH